MSDEYLEWLFILAHERLSLAEIASYLEARRFESRLIAYSDQAALFRIREFDVKKGGSELGGIYKIGGVVCRFDAKAFLSWRDLEKKLDSKEFYDQLDEKIGWGISFYTDKYDFTDRLRNQIEDYFRDRLRRDGVKKGRQIPFKKGSEQELFTYQIVKRGLIQHGLEIVVANIGNEVVFARSMAVSDYQGYMNRDFERPIQNPLISIPPRLARVLVNLTGLGRSRILLDPFCGIGTILQEALVMGFDIRGLDIDTRRVSDTLKNLKWLLKKYHIRVGDLEKKILVGDATRLSTKFEAESIDAVASEPILLPALRTLPSKGSASRMIRASEQIYFKALKETAIVLRRGGLVALVVPLIRGRGSEVITFSLKEAMKEAGLRLKKYTGLRGLEQPFYVKTSKDQKVARAVYVMEKP